MNFNKGKTPQSHGNGRFELSQFKKIGKYVIFEDNVLVFHPENITIGNNVYIGHNTILKGYYKNEMIIGEGTWIGQNCYFHSAGGIFIGRAVGIGPDVKILTSNHVISDKSIPILHHPLEFNKVIIGDGSDLGVGSIILPGIHVGEGAVVGAGAVVTKDIPSYSTVIGVPAKVIKSR